MPTVTTEHANDPSYAAFHVRAEPRLRRALIAKYGGELGREGAAEALAYGWENWDRIRTMDNPVGYLYRVGQSRLRRLLPRPPRFDPPPVPVEPWIEPGLPGALGRLSRRQRQVVILVHGFDYTHREVADLLGISRSSVQNHVERGLAKLRSRLEVDHA